MFCTPALGVVKTKERQFAEAFAGQFLELAPECEIAGRVKRVETDSAHSMIAAEIIYPV